MVGKPKGGGNYETKVVTWHSDGSSGAYEHGHVWKKHDMIGTHMHMVDTHGAWVYCCMGIWVA